MCFVSCFLGHPWWCSGAHDGDHMGRVSGTEPRCVAPKANALPAVPSFWASTVTSFSRGQDLQEVGTFENEQEDPTSGCDLSPNRCFSCYVPTAWLISCKHTHLTPSTRNLQTLTASSISISLSLSVRPGHPPAQTNGAIITLKLHVVHYAHAKGQDSPSSFNSRPGALPKPGQCFSAPVPELPPLANTDRILQSASWNCLLDSTLQ